MSSAVEVWMFLVNYVLPPLVLFLGLVGNTLGLVVLQHPDLNKIGPRDTYTNVLAWDSFYLIQIVVNYLQYTFSINLSSLSVISCKLWNYFNYSLANVSSWLIVYISLERCVSIQFPSWQIFLR